MRGSRAIVVLAVFLLSAVAVQPVGARIVRQSAHVCNDHKGMGLAWLVIGYKPGKTLIHASYAGSGALAGLHLTGWIDTPPRSGLEIVHLAGAGGSFKDFRDAAVLYLEGGTPRWMVLLGLGENAPTVRKVPCQY